MSATATEDSLRRTLLRIDGRGYGAYKDIGGTYKFADFMLTVDAVQGDPFAAPSRLRVLIPPTTAELPARLYSSAGRAIGVSCFLAKAFASKAGRMSTRRGSGKSGEIRIEAPGQQVMANTAVQVHSDGSVEARFTVGLPAQGRRVLGRQACGILLEDLPELVAGSLYARSHTGEELWRHAAANEDADALRAGLAERGLIAFVADGSILPRSSGVDDRPLRGGSVIPFKSPESLKVSFALPNGEQCPAWGSRLV